MLTIPTTQTQTNEFVKRFVKISDREKRRICCTCENGNVNYDNASIKCRVYMKHTYPLSHSCLDYSPWSC